VWLHLHELRQLHARHSDCDGPDRRDVVVPGLADVLEKAAVELHSATSADVRARCRRLSDGLCEVSSARCWLSSHRAVGHRLPDRTACVLGFERPQTPDHLFVRQQRVLRLPVASMRKSYRQQHADDNGYYNDSHRALRPY